MTDARNDIKPAYDLLISCLDKPETKREEIEQNIIKVGMDILLYKHLKHKKKLENSQRVFRDLIQSLNEYEEQQRLLDSKS